MLDVNFSRRLIETCIWCNSPRVGNVSKVYLRSECLKPKESFFEIFQRTHTLLSTYLDQKRLVDHVCTQRGLCLRENSLDRLIIESNLSSGRILFIDTFSTTYDEVAKSASDGFFDESDIPPWDTWVDYVLIDSKENYKNPTGILIAWIPETSLEPAEKGLELCIGESLMWGERTSSTAHLGAIIDEIEATLCKYE